MSRERSCRTGEQLLVRWRSRIEAYKSRLKADEYAMALETVSSFTPLVALCFGALSRQLYNLNGDVFTFGDPLYFRCLFDFEGAEILGALKELESQELLGLIDLRDWAQFMIKQTGSALESQKKEPSLSLRIAYINGADGVIIDGACLNSKGHRLTELMAMAEPV